MIAVRIDIGSSITLIVRESVSMATIKLAPRLKETGITYRLLLPTSIRAQWGIKRPIHPTCPHIDTEEAVMTVAASINSMRVFFRSMPLAFASSSLRRAR